jgi:uncharacterized BrkB/YihY/UPF0761 family membrane protein
MDGRPKPARGAAALTLLAALCVLAALTSLAALLGLLGSGSGPGDWDKQLAASLLAAAMAATAALSNAYVRAFARASRSLTGDPEPRRIDRGPLRVLARLLAAELIVALGVCAVATGTAADAIADFAGISWDASGAWDVAKWPLLLGPAFLAFTALQRSAVADPHPPAARRPHARQVLGIVAWLAAVTGFALYLASFESFTDNYGAVGSGVVLLVSLTLFSVLYYVAPVRVAALGPLGAGAALSAATWLASCGALALCVAAVDSLHTAYAAIAAGIVGAAGLWATNLAVLTGAKVNAGGFARTAHPLPVEATNGAASRDPLELVHIVGRALENDVAHVGLLRPLLDGGQAARLSDFELDLSDWGFTYGVAWAAARAQDPAEPDHSVAARALEAAEDVFRMYCSGSELPTETARSNGHVNGSAAPGDAAARANGHGPPRVLD